MNRRPDRPLLAALLMTATACDRAPAGPPTTDVTVGSKTYHLGVK